MSLVRFRRELARDLGGDVRRGARSLYRPLTPSALLVVFPEAETVFGVKSVGVTMAVYRESDRSAWLREWDLPPDQGYEGTNEVGEFGFLFGAEHLLARPHGHRWSIDGPERTRASSEHVAALVVDNLPRLEGIAEMLPNRRGIPAGRHVLGIPEQAWLAIDETCPWSPCLEQGRRVTAGGVWPEDGTPNDAVSSR